MVDRHDPIDGADDLAELRAFAARLPEPGPDWEQPPAGLWERIAAEAGVPVDAPDTSRRATAHRPPEAPAPPAAEPSPVTDLASRRRIPWILGAVAAVVLLVVGVVALVGRPASDPTVLASTPLERLGDAGSGNAKLVDADGDLRLRVDTADLDPGDGFLEVWLIDTEVSKLVSLGPVRPDGTYDLPRGLDPEQFPVVDVSVEHFDGDPTHSGDSVLRGQLTF